MKKTRFIALALIVALALMGAGYAWWTDTITYQNTISTGKLEMTLMENAGASYKVFDKSWKEPTDRGYLKDKVEIVDPVIVNDGEQKSATFKFENLYPGVKASTVFRAKNTGTVPVTLKSISVQITDTEGNSIETDLTNAIRVQYALRVRDNKGKKVDEIAGGSDMLHELESGINGKLAGTNGGKIIYPDQELVFEPGVNGDGEQFLDDFTFWIDRYDVLQGDVGEEETVVLKITYNFIQANEWQPGL